jgi:hypothetical protein
MMCFFFSSLIEYMRVLDKDSDSDQKIKDLQEELDALKATSKDSEVLLKQAKGQHDEYMR